MYKRLGWMLRRNLMVPMGIEPFDISYLHKALSVGGLVGAWLQGEGAGLISYDSSGHGYNGAYTGVTLGQPGVPGMGYLSPFYDGINDFNNIHSAGFANDNQLLNPGFETPGGGGADIWANWVENAGDGALANEVVIVHEGTDAAKMTGGVTGNTLIYNIFAAVPGTRLRLRFWTRGDGANAGRYRVFDSTNFAPVVTIRTTGVTGAAYAMVEQEFTVPVGCFLITVYFYCPPVNGGIAYFDASEVRRMNGFQPDQGTIIIPAQVANAGVWTDATARRMIYVGVDANNYVGMGRTVANNTIGFDYVAGGVAEAQATGALANLDFAFYGITWDISAGANGEVRYYIDRVPSGATDIALGTWLGDLAAANVVIGASSTIPANVWSGNIGPALLYSDAKPPAEMAYLMTP